MTRTIQDPLALPALGDFTANRPVLSSHWTQLPRIQNRLFSDLGVEIPGRTGTGSSPIFHTTSLTYTQTDGGGGEAVETWHGVCQGWRYLSGATPLHLQMRVFCQGLKAQLTLVHLDDGTILGTSDSGGSASLEWLTVTMLVSLTDAESGGSPRPLGLFASFAHNGSGIRGDLYSFSVRERILRAASSSLLPTS